MAAVDLSVIIVSFNSAGDLPACFEAMSRSTNGVDYEVIVVDNASADGAVQLIEERFPHVRVVANRENTGFARAANMGAAGSRGRHLILLNPDTELQDGALERCVAYLDQHPDVGIVTARVNNPDGTLQRACRRSIPTPKVAFFRLSGLSKIWKSHPAAGAYNVAWADPDETMEVEAVSGSFMMVRREAWEKVGGMDERYFLYGEDLDICLEVSRAGYRIVYYPEAVVVHHKGKSSRQARRRANREFHRAMNLFHRKHFADNTPGLLNLLILGGISLRGTLLDIGYQLGLVRHVGSRG
jgi:GT2 family glycosyltransferase